MQKTTKQNTFDTYRKWASYTSGRRLLGQDGLSTISQTFIFSSNLFS